LVNKNIDAAKEKKIQIKDRVFDIKQKEKTLTTREEEITNKIAAFRDAEKAKTEPAKIKVRKGKFVRDKEHKRKELNQSLISVNTKIDFSRVGN